MPIDAEFLALLRCVESTEPLLYVPAAGEEPEGLFCVASKLLYPFDAEAGFPVMLVEEAERVDSERAAALADRATGAQPS